MPEAEKIADSLADLTDRQEHRLARRARRLKWEIRKLEKQHRSKVED